MNKSLLIAIYVEIRNCFSLYTYTVQKLIKFYFCILIFINFIIKNLNLPTSIGYNGKTHCTSKEYVGSNIGDDIIEKETYELST